MINLDGWLITAATAFELAPVQAALGERGGDFLVCGIGPTAAAASLAAHLAVAPGRYVGVIMAGVAGAYPAADGGWTAELLDICLADCEILGDFGLAAPHGADPLAGEELAAEYRFPLDSPLLLAAQGLLRQWQVPFHCGPLVTVNAATTTLERGRALARHHRALGENMEGAAAALVCRRFRLPLLELRCISNLVEDRDPGRWRLPEAIARNGQLIARLLPALAQENHNRPPRPIT